MAYGSNGDDDYHQLGMFSMIHGIHVKVGEKFKLPERISLPIGWKPSDPTDLLRFEYDFWKENEVISRAEEERLTQVQMEKNVEKETNEDTPVESDTNDVNDEEQEDEEESPNTSTDSNVTEILTPFVLPSEGVENKLDDTHQKINVEEFEDQNQNPFELVELQTLNEYDELRCVLEPTAKGKKIIKSKGQPKTYENFELDANFFNNVDVAQPVPSISSENYMLDYSDNQTVASEAVETRKDDFNIPMHMAKGTLNWTKFNKDAYSVANQLSHMSINGQVPFTAASDQNNVHLSSSLPNGQDPAMMPYEVSSAPNTTLVSRSISEVEIESNENKPVDLSYGQMLFMTDDLPRTKSMPELLGKTEQNFNPNNDGSTPVPVNNCYSSDQSNQMRLNIDRSHVDVVRTDRIDSIMKQYQFQRLSNIPPASNYNPSSSTQMSNIGGGGNMPQYVGMPCFAPNTISTNINTPAESFSKPVPLPFSIQDASVGIHSTAIYNPSNVNPVMSIPSPTQSPTSNFPGMSVNAIPTGYQPDPNPFTQTSIQNNSQVPTSVYRHGILPPLPMDRSHSASTFNTAPQPPPPYSTTYSMSTFSHLTPLSGANQYIHETDLRASQSPLLPNIPSQESVAIHTQNNTNGMSKVSPRTQESLSWLVDPTEDLPLPQKNFAYQISAMGFSLPCVSRTVLRLGVDEKEVLDFLCSVQDLKEKDFHSDDIEMALLNLQNEKEKVPSYLEMVTTLKELGFKPSEIHNALIKTSVDQHKAIDYLTSSR